MGTAGPPCPAADGADLWPPTDAQRVGRTRRGGTILGTGLGAVLQADRLIAAALGEPLHAPPRCGAIDHSRRPRESVRRNTGPPHSRMVGFDLVEHAQGPVLDGGRGRRRGGGAARPWGGLQGEVF